MFLSAASSAIFFFYICWKRNTIKVWGTSKAFASDYNASVKFVFNSAADHFSGPQLLAEFNTIPPPKWNKWNDFFAVRTVRAGRPCVCKVEQFYSSNFILSYVLFSSSTWLFGLMKMYMYGKMNMAQSIHCRCMFFIVSFARSMRFYSAPFYRPLLYCQYQL